jgi:hypothetical protein
MIPSREISGSPQTIPTVDSWLPDFTVVAV